MALDENGKLIEEQTASGRPYVAVNKDQNANRGIFVDKDGNVYHLDAKIKESFSGSVDQTFTFAAARKGITLSNDGSEDLTLTVNGISLVIKTGEVFEGRFDPFTSASVAGTAPYRGYVTD